MDLWTIFATGLFTGGLTCLAVQGGLLAATIAQRQEQKIRDNAVKSGNALPILTFLIAKLVAYTLLGLLLGWFGSLFQLSLKMRVILQFIVGLFMIGTALNMLDVHPVFRYFIIQPPKFLFKVIRNQSRSKDFFAPVLLGLFTVFIPCGTTQAMMALAISSGNPVLGAVTMFVFVLGTSPVFFLLGYFTTQLSTILKQAFLKFAAYAIIALAIFNLNQASVLAGSSVTLENLWHEVNCTIITFCESSSTLGLATEAVQEATINLESNGYNPRSIMVKAGKPVTLHLVNKSGKGCIQAFTIPELNIEKVVRVGTSETISFVAPDKPGQLSFMCGMGMYRGTIYVS